MHVVILGVDKRVNLHTGAEGNGSTQKAGQGHRKRLCGSLTCAVGAIASGTRAAVTGACAVGAGACAEDSSCRAGNSAEQWHPCQQSRKPVAGHV